VPDFTPRWPKDHEKKTSEAEKSAEYLLKKFITRVPPEFADELALTVC
jgi:hypothetical protein